MALTTGLQLPYGVQPLVAVPADSWSGPYDGVDEATAIAAANAAIPSGVRFKSMEVRLIINGESRKYWYYGGILNSDLIEFFPTSFANSKYFPLTGGTISGETKITANLTVYGNLSATGNSYFANTLYSTTSALSVINIGNTGPALYVGNNGTGDIASFYDLDQNIEVFHIGGHNGSFPNVGVKTSTPNKDFTVNGEISASNNIWTSGNFISAGKEIFSIIYPHINSGLNVYNNVNSNSANWDSVYTSVKDVSSNWNSVYTSVKDVSGNWDSVYTSVKDVSSNWDSVYNNVNSTSANSNSVYTSVKDVSSNWDSVYTSVKDVSGNWNSVYNNVNSASANSNSVYTSVKDVSGNWDSVYSNVNSNSASYTKYDFLHNNFLNLTGGIVDGNLSVLSSFEVGFGSTVLFVSGSKVGINTESPTVELTVNGSISASNKIYGTIIDWMTLTRGYKMTPTLLGSTTESGDSGDVYEYVFESSPFDITYYRFISTNGQRDEYYVDYITGTLSNLVTKKQIII